MFAIVHASDPTRPVRLLSGLMVSPHPRLLARRFLMLTGYRKNEPKRRGFYVVPLP
jgi:hypothetical protein